MQEFALVALFAESSEPMFAHNAAVTADMSEGACCTSLAATLWVEFTNSTSGFWNEKMRYDNHQCLQCDGVLLTVHSRKGQGQSAKLLFEGYFDVEFHARDIRHDQIHGVGSIMDLTY